MGFVGYPNFLRTKLCYRCLVFLLLPSFLLIKSSFLQAGVTDLQVMPHGFISCGGDGSVKLVQVNDLTAVHQH